MLTLEIASILSHLAMSDAWWRPIADSFAWSATTTTTASSAPASEAKDALNGLSEEEFRKRAISRMDASMRAKYGRGATYNFKLVLRGDTATGKSTLLRRLRGGTFVATYETTKEIKTAHVSWRAKSCPEDNVALEVWDVVDRAPKRSVSENLTLAKKANAANEGAHTFPLDATVVDVYRGAHACAVLVDPSKRWTFDYAMRTLDELPKHIPSALILNFRDYPDDKRVITAAEATAAVQDAFGSRPFTPVVIETSLLNCYGLVSVSTFLHVPFLCLKRMALEEALKANTTATVQAQEALEKFKEASYEAYTRKLGIHQPTPEEQEAKEKEEKDRASNGTATSEAPAESSLSWNKLSNMTIGEIPLSLAGAALSSTASAVSTIARKTPAELSAEMANNLKNFASLGGGGANGQTDAGDKNPASNDLPPQFSHLGPGGIERAAFGGRDIADEDKAAIDKMIQNKGGDDGQWLDDDSDDGEENNGQSDEEEDVGRNVNLKMDGWDDEEDDDDDAEKMDPDSPAHFIRQIPKEDPFFGVSDEKTNNGKPPLSPLPPTAMQDLDPERLAAAFDAASPPSQEDYETLEDPLGLTLARSASGVMASSESERKEKKKKEKKEKKKEKKSEKSSSKSKSSRRVDWDESD